MDYKQYQAEVAGDIKSVLGEACCQPILFVGSGFTRRYGNGPSWEELLKQLANQCPLIKKEFAYYKQTYNDDLIKIGTIFADAYREWAWGKGKSKFPAAFFSEEYPSDIFIKHAIAEILRGVGPTAKGSYGSAALDAEISALKAMSPHAVITTNYDELIEPLFVDYERVVGQKILKKGYLAIGEIFKIHGCISDPMSLIFVEDDYERFNKDQKYLSAKLLTYFIEHPLIFIGYSAEDPNIKQVLYDVSRMVGSNYELMPNMYILQWDPDISDKSYPARDKVLAVGDGVNIRIKSISSSSFEWVFKAFGSSGNLEKVNTKLLRSLMARAVELIRSDVPKRSVEIDFQTLEHAVETGETFAKLFGVTSIADPAQVNLNYIYTLTGVAAELGYDYWSKANDLIKKLKEESGFDMKASDNVYHISMRTGAAAASVTNKYSQKAVDILRKVRDGQAYSLEKKEVQVERAAE